MASPVFIRKIRGPQPEQAPLTFVQPLPAGEPAKDRPVAWRGSTGGWWRMVWWPSGGFSSFRAEETWRPSPGDVVEVWDVEDPKRPFWRRGVYWEWERQPTANQRNQPIRLEWSDR